jgi:protein ImuB
VLTRPNAARGPQVVYSSTRAARLGIHPGMPLAEALAMDLNVHVVEENRERDEEALKSLATWVERFSPIVGIEEVAERPCLLLDVSACAAYFRGEDQFLRRVHEEMAGEGWIARIALADSLSAAWALAHYGRTPYLSLPGATENDLRSLPVAALRLPDETLGLFARLGIERIEQLMALPRASIPARFSSQVLLRLDQALGQVAELFVPHRLLPEIRAVHSFEYGVDRTEVIHEALEQLMERLHQLLESRGLGARQLECWFHQETAAPLRLEINFLYPCRSVSHLRSLLDTRLEQIQAEEPIWSIGLRVTIAEPVGENQLELFETESLRRENLSKLVDRLSNRLGCAAVTRASLVADAQPEYAYRLDPMVTNAERGTRKADPMLFQAPSPEVRDKRPVCLWSAPVPIAAMSVVPDGPPLQFCWDGTDYRVNRSWGPERIETGWWREADVHRDYYVVATHLESRFWLFRSRDDGRWFLHGCFD